MAERRDPAEVGPRGRGARRPTELPALGWKDVVARLRREAREDQLTFLAGGVAFFALIAVVPALVALVSVFGLVGDPADVERQVTENLAAAPDEVRSLVVDQLEGVTDASGSGLGVALVVSVALALWSASSGMKNLIAAINAVYDETETRTFVPLRGLALVLTLGAVLFVAAAVFVVALLPAVLADSALAGPTRTAIGILRWPGLALAWMAGLAVLYRVAPDRTDAGWRWITPGAVVATVIWLAGSAAFSLYTANFGSYNETYGALGAVVVTMLWLQLTALAVLVGAELNAELEHQTAEDTTTGPAQPLGRRGAVVADHIGATADEVAAQR